MDTNKTKQHGGWVEECLATLAPNENWQPNVIAGLGRLKQMHRTGSWIARRWIWVAATAATAAAVCVCFVVFPSPRVFAHRCLECTVAAWESLAPSRAAQADLRPANGRAVAPDFNLKDAQGKDVKLSDLKGKVVLVNFWATWCEGCQIEIPWFIEFEKKYGNRGLTVIGISMDDEGWKAVKPWLVEKKVNYPIVIGSEQLGKQFGLDGMPLTLLVDGDGKIADSHSGVVNKAATEKKIEVLLAEHIN